MTPFRLVHTTSFSDLVLPHQPALSAAALRLCRGDRASAQDLVQDVLERALRHFARLKALANPRGWLFTILRHRFVDRCRSRRRMVLIDEIEVAAPEAEPLEPPPWAEISRQELLSAVAQLSREF